MYRNNDQVLRNGWSDIAEYAIISVPAGIVGMVEFLLSKSMMILKQLLASKMRLETVWMKWQEQ